MESGPFAEVGGAAAEVDGDVPDVAGQDADQLALGPAELVVETTKDALDRKGLVILDEPGRQTGCLKCRLIEYFCKPTATITKATGLNQFNVA